MSNLGGHDLQSVLEAFESIDHDRPVCFLCYTIKGFGLPFAGHKDNHAGLMNETQMARLRDAMHIRAGHEWDLFEGLPVGQAAIEQFLASAPFNHGAERRHLAEPVPVPDDLALPKQGPISTQTAFGSLLNEIGRERTELSGRVVTMSPDVTVSTNLGPWVNRRGIFGREAVVDTFREQRIASAQRWELSVSGQHFELGIAEMNLFLLLGAAGLSHSLFGVRLLPIGTLYDPFIARGLDALNYACYQDGRFILVATPSGVALAPEGGAHQSIGSPMIGMAQPGLVSYEPAYADELAVLLRWALEHVQKEGDEGSSVYLRLSTRTIDQVHRSLSPELKAGIVSGGYWLSEPSASTRVVLAYQGAVAPEAVTAAGFLAEDRPGVGILALTSADRLYSEWRETQRFRRMNAQPGGGRAENNPASRIEELLAHVPRDAVIVTLIDAYPATLSWLGGVQGHRIESLGVDRFGQTGTVADLYGHFHFDVEGILGAVESASSGRPLRHRWREGKLPSAENTKNSSGC